jgi:hypothetical protein
MASSSEQGQRRADSALRGGLIDAYYIPNNERAFFSCSSSCTSGTTKSQDQRRVNLAFQCPYRPLFQCRLLVLSQHQACRLCRLMLPHLRQKVVNKINDELTLPSIPATLAQITRGPPSGSWQPGSATSSSQPRPSPSQSSSAGPGSSQARRKKDPNAPVPEKRGAKFKPKCPLNILDRVERVREQRYAIWISTRNQAPKISLGSS